ncbi:hypothetical protein BGX28_001075 [Mortierella sp. GBA30]|nr:hypothetical protein BGX28_001075 [Mortierella sp. GBA30]
MKTRVVGIPLLATIALSIVIADAVDNMRLRGVAPSRIEKYAPDSAGNWKCLDGSKILPYTAINDDYCDCQDGSDEPGTSACGTGYFYCNNAGHIPKYIKTSRLNDGVCDPECCDGSDEFNGQVQCPNVCEKLGEESRKERKRVRKVQKEGSKVRQSYVAYGKETKRKLKDQLGKLQVQFSAIQQKSAEAKAALDTINAWRQEYLENTRNEREAVRKVQLAPLIEQQYKRLAHAIDIKAQFRATLDELKEKHNKNYHDLAVKATISGFDEYVKELDQEMTDKAASHEVQDLIKEQTADEVMRTAQDQTYDNQKQIGRMFQLLKAMKEGHNVEYNDEAVLKAIKVLDDFTPVWKEDHNEFVGEDSIEIPAENIDDRQQEPDRENKSSLDILYASIQKGAKAMGFGVIFKKPKTELERVQDAYDKSSESERKMQSDIQELERKLGMDYGKDETFAQLVNRCFEHKDIDKFSEWVGDNYDTQLYTGGTKCWNGPERSVKVVMSCGKDNEIVAVSEPSKCEYLFKFRTPAVCRIMSDIETSEDVDIIPQAVMPGEVEKGNESKKHDEL